MYYDKINRVFVDGDIPLKSEQLFAIRVKKKGCRTCGPKTPEEFLQQSNSELVNTEKSGTVKTNPPPH